MWQNRPKWMQTERNANAATPGGANPSGTALKTNQLISNPLDSSPNQTSFCNRKAAKSLEAQLGLGMKRPKLVR